MKTLLLLCILFLLNTGCFASEATNAEKVTNIINKSKILGENTRVVSSVSGTEAVVSTYRHRDSVNIDNDCKIDASLIAKELMISNDLGLRRVVIHFHEPDLTGNYREVSVSFAEIKAFAAGAVEQKDFLASLGLNLLPEPGNKTAATLASSQEPSKSATAPTTPDSKDGKAAVITTSDQKPTSSSALSSGSSASSANAGAAGQSKSVASAKSVSKAVLPRQRFSSPKCGFVFLLPYGWTLELANPSPTSPRQRMRRPSTSDLVFVLRNPATGYKQIECYRKTDRSTPDLSAAKMKQDFSYPGAKIDKYQSVAFGKGRYAGAMVVARYPHEAGEYHETHLYFGSPGMYYDLRGWGPTNDPTFEPAFSDLIATIEFPVAKPAKK